MPDAADFLDGFGLIEGTEMAGYRLTRASSSHETIRRYQEYRYDITLVFTNLGQGVYENLYGEVLSLISQERIIYGIRNPYRCIIDTPQYGDIEGESDGTIIFHLTGHSYRVKQ